MSSVIVMQFAMPKQTSFLGSFSNKVSPKRRRFTVRAPRSRCSSQLSDEQRRSGGYQPTLWDFDYIQSLNSQYEEEVHRKRAEASIAKVKTTLLQEETDDDVLMQLELIDDLQRLGISCHFDEEIKQILNSAYFDRKYYERDLYSTALAFRLLRQHGFSVSQEVFDYFKNEKGNDFKASLDDDTKGLLQLYEASFLSTHGEETLELAAQFATKTLKKMVLGHEIHDEYILSSVGDALDVPVHWRARTPYARLFIDAYKRRPDMNPLVLELAILDINIVQAQFQKELKEASRWWNGTGIAQRLPFVRDRIVESYYWTTGVVECRQHGYERIMLAKINALVATIDDIYDVYGTVEELRVFTNAIQRWDMESMNQLPPYMQLCYLALHNFVNEMAYDTLKEKGFNSIPFLRKTWVDLVESYMREAEWYHNGHKPSLEEYMKNAWISVGGLPILSHLFFRVTDSIDEETAASMHEYHDVVRASCMITRLADDLGTSLDEVKRGDVPKSVQCYMNENNTSEEEAREHVRSLIVKTWRTMNKELFDSPFLNDFLNVVANLGRMAQCVYQHESDGFGMQDSRVNKMLRGLLFDPYA